MIRDRLKELKKIQNAKSKQSLHRKNSTEDDSSDETENLIQIFESVEDIRHWMEQIERNNKKIRTYFGKIVDLIFNQKDTEEKVKSLFQINIKLAHQITGKLKEFVDAFGEKRPSRPTDYKIILTQCSSLKKRIENAYLENEKLLDSYENIQKQIIKSKFVAKGHFQVTTEQVGLFLKEGTSTPIFNILEETDDVESTLANAKERHQQFLETERTIQEVHDLFEQMQEIVDRVEVEVESDVENVGSRSEHLKKSRKMKKKHKRKKICFIITITSVLAVGLLLITLIR